MSDLTFFVWSDTHFGYEQRFADGDLRGDVVTQMNRLPGWPYPPEVGGAVAAPAFVMHCGDIIDGEHHGEAGLALRRYFTAGLRFPVYETLGNHDLHEPFLSVFRQQYGGASYSFAAGGCHAIALAGEYDAAEVGTIGADGLAFLRRDLATVAAGTPILLFTHSRLDRVRHGADVLTLLAGHRVVAIVSGHLHRPAYHRLNGIACLDVGHCRNHPQDPESGRSFSVVRLQGGTLSALAWRWDCRDWDRGQRQAGYPALAGRAFVNLPY